MIAPLSEESLRCYGEQVQSFDFERGGAFFRPLGQMGCKPAAAISRINCQRAEKTQSAEDLHPHHPDDLSFLLQNQKMAEVLRGNVALGQFTKDEKLSDQWFISRERRFNGHLCRTPFF
jgi:hypothetical protein